MLPVPFQQFILLPFPYSFRFFLPAFCFCVVSQPFVFSGSCLDRRGAGLCSWNSVANIDKCTLYYNVSVLRVSSASFLQCAFVLLYFVLSHRISSILFPAAQNCIHIHGVGSIAKKGNFLEGALSLRSRRISSIMPAAHVTFSSQIAPNVSFPCFTTDAVAGDFQIYYGGQPPYSSKVREIFFATHFRIISCPLCPSAFVHVGCGVRSCHAPVFRASHDFHQRRRRT
jgi:hypothetical protein